MIYAYIRVSTDKQHQENQKYEIEQFASANNLYIDKWIEETISSKKNFIRTKILLFLNKYFTICPLSKIMMFNY